VSGIASVAYNGRSIFISQPELGALVSEYTADGRSSRSFGVLPVVRPAIGAAAVDPEGNLWVSLTTPVTYVYDASGDKRRTVQFHAAGIISPRSLFFTRDHRLLVTPGCYAFRSDP
jgi:hypothetical protein